MTFLHGISPWEDEGEESVVRDDLFLILLKTLALVGGSLFVYSFLRASLLKRKASLADERAYQSKSDLMIETFQGLIKELKEKKEALEETKKVAEDHAKHVESYNENILQSVPSGVMTFNLEKTITTFNNAAGTILALSPESSLNRSYASVFEKSPKMQRLLDETLEKECDMPREDCELERLDGKKIWLGLNTSLLRDRHGRIIGATLVFTDLTEKKLLEEQVALKKRLEMMGEMSAWIAHEFRNYMGTILGFSRLLEKRMADSDDRKEMIQSITDELSSMERLITELLSYGKKMVIHPEMLSLPALFQAIKKQFSEDAHYQEIVWSCAFESTLPQIEADPVLMPQALANLIRNGLEAMEGKGALEIRAYNRPGKKIQIEISDTGTGIPEDLRAKIFLPFFTTKEEGTGLGLSLVHKIVLSHNGHIRLENSKTGGATFVVALPVYHLGLM